MTDGGFDRSACRGEKMVGSPSGRPFIDESLQVREAPTRNITKKLLAFSIVSVLVLSAGVALAPKAVKKVVLDDDSAAHALAGEREVSYRFTDFFNLSKKPEAIGSYAEYQKLGRWNWSTDPTWWAPPTWFDLRAVNYDEYIAHDTYPFVLAYAPYSTETNPTYDMGHLTTSWYRLYMDANNITEIGTALGEDPLFVPVRGTQTSEGGWYNLSWYSTYMANQEIADARKLGSAHYSEFYYGANWLAPRMPTANSDDGYYHELQGKMDFNREACSQLLGLPGTGDLKAEFNSSRGDIETDWLNKYIDDGGADGDYDIYTAYDYVNDVMQMKITLDPDYYGDPDDDTLHLRFWSLSWGNDCLLVRYLEAAEVWKFMQGWADDWYLNVSVGPTQGDIDMRAVIAYHLTAWKDSLFWGGGWTLETVHLDWCGNFGSNVQYTSPYNPYDPDETDVVHKSWAPGTTRFGMDVSYALAPLEWDLDAGETIVIELPPATQDVMGYEPYQSGNDLLDDPDAKLTELYDHSYWGTLTVGNGWPYSGDTNLRNYYDEESRTFLLEGPIDFPRNELSAFPGLLDCGSPTFFFGVSNVTEYEVGISEPDPYEPGVDYTLTVTAKNYTGAVITCNNTIDLSSDDLGVVFGLSAYKFNFSDSGVWSTTVRLSDYGSWTVYVEDRDYGPQVVGSLGVTVIPEFGMLLIPVIGVAAMVLFMRSARRRRLRDSGPPP